MSQFGDQGSPTAHTDSAGKVGYGKPPEEHRFKKGVSGNPRGRPKKNFADMGDLLTDYHSLVLQEANRPIKVNECGRTRKISVVRGVLRVLEAKALKGDIRAAEIFVKEVRSAEQGRLRERRRQFERQFDYKQRWLKEMHRCDKMGDEPPEPVPHPADMVVDSLKEVVIINGPADDVQKAQWDEREAEKQAVIQSIQRFEAVLAGPTEGLAPYGGSRELVLNLIADAKRRLAGLSSAFPSEEQRRQAAYVTARYCSQDEVQRAPSVIHPATGTTGAARIDRRMTVRKMSSCLNRAEAAVKELIKQSDYADESVVTQSSRKIKQSGCKKTDAKRQALRKRIAYLEEQLTCSEEELDPRFASHHDAAFLLEEIKMKLFELDDP